MSLSHNSRSNRWQFGSVETRRLLYAGVLLIPGGGHLQMDKPPRYGDLPPRSTQPGHPFMGKWNEYRRKLGRKVHTSRGLAE